MKIRKLPYKHIHKATCGCSRCHAPAVAQFYICALDGHVAVCAYHDWLLNLKAVLVATSNSTKEATPWMTAYTNPGALQAPKRKSPAKRKKLKKRGIDAWLSSGSRSAQHWRWE